MPEAPLISIIIAAYQAERYLPATLDGVLAQTLPAWECLIVDDGSRDGTAEVARAYLLRDGRFRLVQRANGGIAPARNSGYEQADPGTEFVIFLDSDDIWLPDSLERLMARLRAHPEAVAVHGLGDLIDYDGERMQPGAFADQGRTRFGFDGRKVVPWPLDKPTVFESLYVTSNVFPPGLVLLRRAVLEKVGPSAPVTGLEDYDLWLRMSRHGPLEFLNEVVIWYRRHDQNLSRNHQKNYESNAFIQHKAFFSEENDERQRRIVRGAYRAKQLFKAAENWREAWGCLRRVEVRPCGKQLLRVVGNLARALRGYPTLRG